MNARRYLATFWATCVPVAVLVLDHARLEAASDSEARVTRIIREVNILPFKADPKPATLNEQVSEGMGVRTGNESRSELTFLDLTISRLGANSLFSFNKAGRNVDLGGGSLLLRVPKNSGGAHISASAVTVGVAGTTLILESAGRSKLIVLEGAARISLRRFPLKSASVRGGQMIDVPPGATELPPVVNINVDQVMKTHPLITDFPPLPTRDAIYAGQPNAPVQGQPVGGGSGPGISVNVPIIGPLVGSVPVGPPYRGGGRGEKTKPREGSETRGESSTNDGVRTKGSKQKKHPGGTSSDGVAAGATTANPNYGDVTANAVNRGYTTNTKPTPTPPPRRRAVKRHGH